MSTEQTAKKTEEQSVQPNDLARQILNHPISARDIPEQAAFYDFLEQQAEESPFRRLRAECGWLKEALEAVRDGGNAGALSGNQKQTLEFSHVFMDTNIGQLQEAAKKAKDKDAWFDRENANFQSVKEQLQQLAEILGIIEGNAS